MYMGATRGSAALCSVEEPLLTNWKQSLRQILESVDDWSDDIRTYVSLRNGYDTLVVVPYAGYGNALSVRLRGRVLSDRSSPDPTRLDSTWKNLTRMYRSFETDEVPHAEVSATFNGVERAATADDEGYFTIDLPCTTASEARSWHDAQLTLLAPLNRQGKQANARAPVLIPPTTARFGIISDIDDTILKTGVGNKARMILTTLLSNAHTRMPFAGVAAFYQALSDGASGAEHNPIFYVSSSPYNLHDLLVDFMDLQEIPQGPIFLKDFGIHTPFTSSDHTTHKSTHIAEVLAAYPDLPFVLIGDDGEQDLAIYCEVARRHPGRIPAIYIRTAMPGAPLAENSKILQQEMKHIGSEVVFASDSTTAAQHAASTGYISPSSMSQIGELEERDNAAPDQADIA